MAEGEIRTWEQLEHACNLVGVTLEQAVAATLNGLGEEEDEATEVIEDLDLVYKLLDTARQELLDEAHSGNLARRHHLESAVAAFEDIGTLFRAEDVIRQVLDVREHEEVPTEDLPAGS